MARVGSLLALLALLAAVVPATARSEPTVVAVLDGGASASHPELAGRLLPGIDLAERDDDPEDTAGHGTAVAIVVATACPGCRVLPVRVVTPDGAAPWERVARGLVWAVDRGARVVNLSISANSGSPELRDAVDYAVSHSVLVVAAAGNEGDERPQYPAAYPGVVAVSSADAFGHLHDWSSRGAWVDVAAPGCAPLSVLGETAWACGTSFAAPLVAGLAGAALAAEPWLDASALAARLPALAAVARESATPVRVVVSGSAAPGGLLRAAQAGYKRILDLHERIRWFRCRAYASPYACTQVSEGSSYRVRAGDVGARLVARVVTEPFDGLWLASSAPILVRGFGFSER